MSRKKTNPVIKKVISDKNIEEALTKEIESQIKTHIAETKSKQKEEFGSNDDSKDSEDSEDSEDEDNFELDDKIMKEFVDGFEKTINKICIKFSSGQN